MKLEHKKIESVVIELLANSLEANASDVNINITINDKEFVIKITDNGKGMDEETVSEVKRTLNQPHRKDMEDYYGALAGNLNRGGSSGSGFNLLGIQIDEAQVESSKEGTTIIVKRKRG